MKQLKLITLLFLVVFFSMACWDSDPVNTVTTPSTISDPESNMLTITGNRFMRNGKPVYLAGVGDPERRAYLPNRDRLTRNQIKWGGNIYPWYAIMTHGGDGVYYDDGHTYNPFIDHDPKKGLDESILDSWELSFNLADQNNIITLFNFFDDEARPFGKNRNTITPSERDYIIQIVQRFKHYNNWIWMIAEEYSEIMSRKKALAIAAIIKEYDPYHPIAIHGTNSINFRFAGTIINVFLVQYNDADADTLYNMLSQAVREAAGRYAVVLYESTHPKLACECYGYGAMARKKDRAVADAGAHIMRYDRGENRFSKQDLMDLRALQIDMEAKLAQ